MTKDEMTALLRSVSCDENTITAMGNAYELGFEQGANVAEVMRNLVEEAESICNQVDDEVGHIKTGKFWNLFEQLRSLR
jgi:hypothetical protein